MISAREYMSYFLGCLKDVNPAINRERIIEMAKILKMDPFEVQKLINELMDSNKQMLSILSKMERGDFGDTNSTGL